MERVEDSLRLFPAARSRPLLEADHRDDVVNLVAAEPATAARAAAWRAVFLGECDSSRLLELAAGDDPLLGWTAANMLRSEPPGRGLDEALHTLLRHPSLKVRWRAAHALGARPKRRNVAVLLERLDTDSAKWVRYGAIRALVELAAADKRIRGWVLEALRKRVVDLSRDFVVLRGLERALILRDPPPDWPNAVAPLIEELWAAAGTLVDQDHWRRVGWRVTRAAQAA